MSDEVHSSELCELLEISPAKLREWRKESSEDDPLPFRKHKGKFLYDVDAVGDWLVRTGRGIEDDTPEDPGPIFKTQKDLANFFNVSRRTVMDWGEDPSFPGKAGRPNQRNSHYEAKAVARWLQNKGKRTPIPAGLLDDEQPKEHEGPSKNYSATSRDRLTDLRADKAAIELKRIRGELIDAQEAVAFYTRTNHYATTVLKSLPSRMQAGLPSDTSDVVRRAVDKTSRMVVADVMEVIAELIEGDQDAKE